MRSSSYQPQLSDVLLEVDDVLRFTLMGDVNAYCQCVLSLAASPDDPTGVSFERHLASAGTPFEYPVEESGTKVLPKIFSYWSKDGGTYMGMNTFVTIQPVRTADMELLKSPFTFELQFHTQESYQLKSDKHELYETFRDTSCPPEKKVSVYRELLKIWHPDYFKREFKVDIDPFFSICDDYDKKAQASYHTAIKYATQLEPRDRGLDSAIYSKELIAALTPGPEGKRSLPIPATPVEVVAALIPHDQDDFKSSLQGDNYTKERKMPSIISLYGPASVLEGSLLTASSTPPISMLLRHLLDATAEPSDNAQASPISPRARDVLQ
eukprot:122108_1